MQNINHVFQAAKIENISSKSKKTPKREKFIGYTLKIKAECDSSFLKALSHGEPPDYDDFFFDENGTLKSTFISDFNISREISGHRLGIKIDSIDDEEDKNMMFLNIDVSQFRLAPVFGKLYVIKFIINLEPADDELLFLNEAVKKDQLTISILEPPKYDFNEE